MCSRLWSGARRRGGVLEARQFPFRGGQQFFALPRPFFDQQRVATDDQAFAEKPFALCTSIRPRSSKSEG
jgi:hypothetical protein